MNATQARQLLLVRACEACDPPAAIWTAADQAWASDEALRVEGEHVTPERWLLKRAELAAARLASRDPVCAALAFTGPGAGPGADRAWVFVLPVAVAFLVGLGSNAIGPSRQVNLLAPPLLAVLVWNLAVYAVLVIHAVASQRRLGAGAPTSATMGWLAGAVQWMVERPTLNATPTHATPVSSALRRCTVDWALASRPLQTARLATVMHLAAAALAMGALGGLYLRGLAFEFRAGWDSTFLHAEAVHTWLTLLLGPAAWVAGLALPDATQLDALRFSRGSGENAGRWIHLYAITTAALVLLPRGVLALSAAWRSATLQRTFPMSLDEPWVQRLLRHLAHARHGTTQPVTVLPYSYHVAAERRAALATALAAERGPGLHLTWVPSVPVGGEDELDGHWPHASAAGQAPALVVALFALTATPERETHGAFLTTVRVRCTASPPAAQCLVVIDESGFRQRLSGPDLTQRLAQRRAAWEALLEPMGLRPLFVDLGAAAQAASR